MTRHWRFDWSRLSFGRHAAANGCSGIACLHFEPVGVLFTATAAHASVAPVAVDVARDAITDVDASEVGEHLEVIAEGDRLVTHLFDCHLAGYRGWLAQLPPKVAAGIAHGNARSLFGGER